MYLSAVIIAAAFIGCSKDDSDSEQQQTKAVCHFDDFRRANGNPQITYGTTADGKRCRQIGRICMDMMILDATDIEVERGDEVTLLGEGAMSMEEASQIVGTINYELTCLVTDRARRVYIYPESV